MLNRGDVPCTRASTRIRWVQAETPRGDQLLDCGYRIDVLVNDLVIVELKTVEKLLPIHDAQLLTYLKLYKRPLGLLMNFNVPALRHGIKRLVNQYEEPSVPPRLGGD